MILPPYLYDSNTEYTVYIVFCVTIDVSITLIMSQSKNKIYTITIRMLTMCDTNGTSVQANHENIFV